MMNAHEAWLYLAGLWDQPIYDDCGIADVIVGDRMSDCVCGCISIMWIKDMIDSNVKGKMVYMVLKYKSQRGITTPYIWPLTPEYAPNRAALCRELAAMCEAQHACT